MLLIDSFFDGWVVGFGNTKIIGGMDGHGPNTLTLLYYLNI